VSGFGTAPYGIGPFGTVYTTPSTTDRGTIPESQMVDVNGLYAFKADGSFEGANNSSQRVLVLLATRATQPMKIGADFVADNESRIRSALTPLTSGTAPAIDLQAIEVTDDGRSGTKTRVVFADLLDGGKIREVTL
jgi:hypothetical protein